MIKCDEIFIGCQSIYLSSFVLSSDEPELINGWDSLYLYSCVNRGLDNPNKPDGSTGTKHLNRTSILFLAFLIPSISYKFQVEIDANENVLKSLNNQ